MDRSLRSQEEYKIIMISKAKYKICRRLGPIYEKCQTQKYLLSEGKKAKSKSGKRPKALSEYGNQLIEKQKIRFTYGISEKQLSNYFSKATESKGSHASEYIYEALESRLDNVVYRLGLASTRLLARQMVSHGHILVNGKKVKVPSMHTRVNDVIGIREGSKNSTLFAELDKKLKNYSVPNWMKFDLGKSLGTITGKPKNTEGFFNINTVLEFYSR